MLTAHPSRLIVGTFKQTGKFVFLRTILGKNAPPCPGSQYHNSWFYIHKLRNLQMTAEQNETLLRTLVLKVGCGRCGLAIKVHS